MLKRIILSTYLLLASTVAIHAQQVIPQPSAIGGSKPFLANSLSNTAVTVKSSAGTLQSYYCYNPNASVAYVQIYDTSGAITVGTTTPKWSIGIPATSAANLGLPQNGLGFANALKVAATTGATNSTAPGTALDCNFGFK